MICRICLEPDNLISVCGCSGTMKFVHKECIDKWRDIKQSKSCELCQQPYQLPGNTVSCAGVVYIAIGVVIATIHADVLYLSMSRYPGDLYNSFCGSFLMIAMYAAILCLLRFFKHIYTKIAYLLWPLSFFSISILLQSREIGFERVELWSSYILFVVFFISWATVQTFRGGGSLITGWS